MPSALTMDNRKAYAAENPYPKPDTFPFTAVFERYYPEIRKEVEQLLKQKVWNAYLDPTDYEGHWDVFLLYVKGVPHANHCKLCPTTARLLNEIPDLQHAVFSCLSPGTVIKPHLGSPGILKVHLGVQADEGMAGWEVAGETRLCAQGKVTIFEDGCLHRAWNNGAVNRITLVFDTVAPYFDEAQKQQAMDTYNRLFLFGYLLRNIKEKRPPNHWSQPLLTVLLWFEPVLDWASRILFPPIFYVFRKFSNRKRLRT